MHEYEVHDAFYQNCEIYESKVQALRRGQYDHIVNINIAKKIHRMKKKTIPNIHNINALKMP